MQIEGTVLNGLRPQGADFLLKDWVHIPKGLPISSPDLLAQSGGECRLRSWRSDVAEDEVEAVAKAFYYVLEGARDWEREPEVLKERFRKDARAAIDALNDHREIVTSRVIPPLVISEELGKARDRLMTSHEVSVLPVPGFRAFRAVVSGPDHTFDTVNEPYFGLVGHRELVGRPVREALPELRGQGYYELLDHVYQTRKSFVGHMMRIMVQAKPGAPLEEHIIDFVYRPIENTAGQVRGLFVEGYDRTAWARA